LIKKIFLTYLVIIFLSSSLWSQKVIIYGDCNFKPYSYCEGDKIQGISIDIFKSIFRKMDDYSVEVKGIDFKDGLKKMENNEILMLGTTPYKPKKRPYITNYSKPYIYHEEVIYCNKNVDGNITSWPQDFSGLKIAVMKGFDINKNLQDAIDKGDLEIIEGNAKEDLDSLIYQKVDCYINHDISIRGELLKLKETFKKNDTNISLDDIKKVLSISHSSYHIGFSNANFPAKDDLIEKINLAIKIMENSKEMEDIKRKHLDLYLHPETKVGIDIALFNFGNKIVSKKLDGYGVLGEIVSKSFESENISVNYQFHNNNNNYLLTKWGRTCMSLPWLNIGDRERYFYFSDTLKPTAMYFFYNTKFNKKGSIKNDFKSYSIGGIEGYPYESEIFNTMTTVQYTSFKTWRDLIEALLSNKIDVVFAKKNKFYTNLEGFLPSKKRLILANKKPMIQQINYAIFSKKCKNSKELRDKFNKGLKRIKKRGIFDKILKKYNMTIDEFNGLKDNRIDSDYDGIFNAYDKCEETPTSIKVDQTGCQRTINPYTMKIIFSKDRIKIDGYISSIKRQDEFVDKLREIYPIPDILDELSIDEGEPDGWINFISDVAGELKLLIDASIKIIGKVI